MLSRTEIVEILTNMTTEKNKGRIEELLGKLERTGRNQGNGRWIGSNATGC